MAIGVSWGLFSFEQYADPQAESFSMHGPIYGHLMNGCLGMLNKLGQEIAQKRDEAMPQIGYDPPPSRQLSELIMPVNGRFGSPFG